MLRRSSISLAATALLAVATPRLGHAQDAHFNPDFVAHDYRLESIALGVAVAPLLSGLISQSHRGGAPDAAHGANAAASSASDIVSVGGVGLMVLGATGAEVLRDDAVRFEQLRAGLVVIEASLFATTMTDFPKRIVGRCRPKDWDDSRQLCDPSGEKNADSAYAAFWSGTTAQIAGAAGAASCLALREGQFGWTALVGLVGEGAAVATGALRVSSGAHSWTDVGAAFVAGNALGFAMCYLHPAANPRVDRVAMQWHVDPRGVSLEARF